MKKIVCVLLIAGFALALLAGCRTNNSGSREYVPGKGWVPTR